MTENDAKEYLEDMLTEGQYIGDEIVARDDEEAIRLAISALEEIQQYQAIGTVEECREARGRKKARKPVTYQGTNRADCPVCGNTVRGIGKPFGNYCSRCGQKLDWRILNGNG